MAKTASKSCSLSSFYSNSHHFLLFLMYALYSTAHPPQTFLVQAKISTVWSGLAYLPDYLSVFYDYATVNFNMPILYALEYRYYCRHYGNFSQISSSVVLNAICVVFSLVWTQSSIVDGTLCKNVSQLEDFTCSTS